MRKITLWLSIFASCMAITFHCDAQVQGAEPTPNPESTDFNFPSFEKLFPPVPKFLADETNRLLSLVVEYGASNDNIAKSLHSFEKTRDFKGIRKDYKGRRDYAIALSSAGKMNEARKALAQATNAAGTSEAHRTELGLIRSLIELRANAYGPALEQLNNACSGTLDSVTLKICAHLKAQFLSIAGDRAGAAAAIRKLREVDVGIQYPFKAIPATAEWDAVRTAHFDVMRHVHPVLWSSREDEELAYIVTQQFLGFFLKGLELDKPNSDEVFNAMKALYNVDITHNNFRRAVLWPNMYSIIVSDEIEKRKIVENDYDYLRRLLKIRKLTLISELREGDERAYKETLEDVVDIIENRLPDEDRLWERYSLASDLDVPENSDLATKHFEQLWEALQQTKDTSDLARVMAWNTGIRLITLYTRRGDLRSLEKYRSETRDLAVRLEQGPFIREDGSRFHASHVDLETARAILNYSPQPERLAYAEKLLLELSSRLKGYVDLTKGKPEDGHLLWYEVSRSLENEKDPAKFQILQDAAILQADSLPILGRIYLKWGRYAEAESFLRRAIAVDMKRYSVCESTEQARYNLDLSDAAERLGRSKDQNDAIRETLYCLGTRDWKSPDLARALARRAEHLRAGGDLYFAEYALQRSIIIQRALKKPADRSLAAYLDGLTLVRIDQGDRDAAMRTARAASEIVISLPRPDWTGTELNAVEHLLTLLTDQKPATPKAASEQFETVFNIAQRWIFSQAGSALQSFSRRTQIRDPKAASLIQQREELLRQRDLVDRQFNDVFASAGAGENTATREKLVARLEAIDEEIKSVSSTLSNSFLDTSVLTDANPVQRADLAAFLRPEERLLIFISGEQATLAVLVDAEGVQRVHRIDMTPADMANAVQTLRCGLDEAIWLTRAEAIQQQARCLQLGVQPPDLKNGALNFKFDVAYALYRALIQPFDELIKNKDLVVIATGPLSALPLHVLVTAPGETDYARASWLVRNHAITVIPSVASLKALRQQTKPATKVMDFLGVGNPLLEGEPKDETEATLAKAARAAHSL